ncbi:hypothetical protein ZEAMMB73_Zm00001d006072 [Zea mays]|uniref:Ubiquitin-like protease family profile domain-containing protein n=1 Tax=Zea mays TaxID=4577 RepID=A0A1D6ESP4_MAIZE|nr:hypothetical protein ZEAMMB73_Zm00001d006072 [Zea mays]
MIIGFCLLWMESKEENVALTIIQRDNTLSIDESLLMSLSHNKPKKSVTTTIVPKDYICTQGDLALIDWIKEIPCEPRVEVVLIDDAFVERKWMECLFQPDAYLGDEVIDCYINLIKAQEHLKCRSGDELYPSKDMAQISSAERRVLLYLDHDMVFIPINIREMHSYLAVINARNMEIQVLDSLGTSSGRNDLIDTVSLYKLNNYESLINLKSQLLILCFYNNIKIKGLQRQIDMVFQRKELKDHRWPDLRVASWPLREIEMEYAKQTDSSSCGLFLLNYIEYWTGDELSDNFTQDDMESHMSKDEMIKDKKHYMDMRFWRMVGFGKLPKYHQDPTAEELANTLDCWPSLNYYITDCKYVLMPWKFNGCYTLFIIDHGKKHVTFIDFTPTQDWCKHMSYKRFAEAIIMAFKKYKIAYNKKRSGWADDIFKWEHTIRSGLPLDLKGVNTSYFVLQAMVMWGSGRRMEFNRDAKILRRNFVIDLLSYEENSCRYAIPPNIQQRLISIAKKD